ncbi:MAG: ABC transporter substrate binding protein [Spirochaetota bacterium]
MSKFRHNSPRGPQKTQPRPARIEVLLSSDNTIYEQGLYGIRTIIEEKLHVSYLDIITAENADIGAYFQKLEKGNTSLLVAIGPAAAKVAQKYLQSIPIVFSMVNSPKSLNLAADNLCGVSMDVSIAEFFKTLNDINPEIRRVHSFYSTDEGALQAGEGNYNDLKYHLLYSAEKLDKPEAFASSLEKVKETTNAFYMVSDPLYNKERFEILSNFCKKNGIILMTSFPTLVKLGATFAISPDYSKIGVLTGQMVNRILAGSSSCSKEGVILPKESSLYINEAYAKESGVTLPQTIRDRARLTRLFSAGVNLMNDGKLKSARIVFEAILKKDPENKSAKSYLDLILQKLTRSKTDSLMASADRYFANRNYTAAASEYRKITKINPNITIAEKKYKEAILGLSEQQRARANSYDRQGLPFVAIKTYQQSLATLATNNRASSELAALRARERRKIPVYLQNGINEYDKRNYETAIPVFENILLVDSSNKQAQEYLRLSKKKQEAIQRLKAKLKRDF